MGLKFREANSIFKSVWKGLKQVIVEKGVCFPPRIVWLNGAPGAGKGTQTPYIIKTLGLATEPILVSDLLQSPAAVRFKDNGLMVSDAEVTNFVLHELLNPAYQNGAVVDGYPRTMVQAECLKLLFNRIRQLNCPSSGDCGVESLRTTVFHVVVLLLDEAESIRRQLHRGRKSREHNEEVQRFGLGEIVEVRKTDESEVAARDRFRTFKEVTYEPLRSLQKAFSHHTIDALGSIEEVQQRVASVLGNRTLF